MHRTLLARGSPFAACLTALFALSPSFLFLFLFCGHLRILINKILAPFDPVAIEQVSAQSDQKFGKRCRKLIFKMAAVAAILDFLSAHLAILCLQGALMLIIGFNSTGL